MKKLITLVLALVCVLGLVGCNQKAVSASEVYSFPEPTTMITVSFYSQGEETAFEIGSEEYDSNDLSTTPVINWFYDLKLTACDEPEAVEGLESYEFYVKGESAFTYEDRGSEAYISHGSFRPIRLSAFRRFGRRLRQRLICLFLGSQYRCSNGKWLWVSPPG